MKSYFLYEIVNNINDKKYFGISSRPYKRRDQHFYSRNYRAVSILHNAIDKYGVNNFTFNILCEGAKEYILELEVKAIKYFKTQEFGYNIKPGGESGAGYSMPKTAKDKPQYVSGFWFPNVRSALKALNMDKSTLQRRRKEGNLGDVGIHFPRKDWSQDPCYVGGFWFPSIFFAALSLNVTAEALNTRIKRNSVEQAFGIRDQLGSNNHMFGISSDMHPSSKKVKIEGIFYDSLKDAVLATGYSKYIINKRIRDNNPDFILVT